jgi:hypothetical protein
VSPVCALRGDPLLFLADQFPFTVDSPRNALKIVFVKGSHTLSVRGIEIRF